MPIFCDASSGTPPLRLDKRSHGDLTLTEMNSKELGADVQNAVEQDFKLYAPLPRHQHCRLPRKVASG